MSRVGKIIINIPNGVRVEYADSVVTVTGSKGELRQEIKSSAIYVVIENNQVFVKRSNDESQTKALHGLYNKLIQNMIEGVTKGFTKTLILNGVGYKANLKGADLTLNLGHSHPCEVKAEEGVTFKVCTPQEIQNLKETGVVKQASGADKEVVVQVSGADKEKVGSMASRIRGLRPVEPYHLYGIRYSDEKIVRKESKSGKKK